MINPGIVQIAAARINSRRAKSKPIASPDFPRLHIQSRFPIPPTRQ